MKIDIFGTKVCGNCRKLEAMLTNKDIPYTYLTIGTDISIEEITDIIDRTPRSVPIILVNGEEQTLEELNLMMRLVMIPCNVGLSNPAILNLV